MDQNVVGMCIQEAAGLNVDVQLIMRYRGGNFTAFKLEKNVMGTWASGILIGLLVLILIYN